MIKAILFDFDDTIGNRREYTYQTFAYLLDTYHTIEDPYERECILQDCMIWDMRGNFDKEFIFQQLKRKYDLDFPILSFKGWWLENQPKFSFAFSGAEEALALLKQKYTLALVTNGNDQSQRQKVKNTHLEKYFDVIVTSQEVGKKKPAPDIYKRALKECGICANEALFVGDTFSTDLIGAHRLGIPCIWITPYDYPCSLEIKQIRHIRELLDLKEEVWKDIQI